MCRCTHHWVLTLRPIHQTAVHLQHHQPHRSEHRNQLRRSSEGCMPTGSQPSRASSCGGLRPHNTFCIRQRLLQKPAGRERAAGDRSGLVSRPQHKGAGERISRIPGPLLPEVHSVHDPDESRWGEDWLAGRNQTRLHSGELESMTR